MLLQSQELGLPLLAMGTRHSTHRAQALMQSEAFMQSDHSYA